MNPILQLRKRLNVSQVDLGNAIGVTQSAISQYEKDKAIPSPENVRKMIDFAKARGVDISFESIYTPDETNGPVDRAAASDDTQPPVGGTNKNRKMARMEKAA